ncbi:MAG: L-glyceraldehyde 3-phosphate reductase [Treponema sp.]|jgi:L-glyceraldehyde 3-phosphate reductase|nr:L-glyceraldehyde 3-phosphate reductase [Treponema sp.]
MKYMAKNNRYESMKYRFCGRSGLKLPEISLGLWHNFGDSDKYDTGRETILSAFDSGITHFDLANNYGPPPGSAEINFGRIFRENLVLYRDEIIISTKAGYNMWPGPYGEWGSRKYLIASLDQSLKRIGLDYVDIFYHHRPDPDTPLEETMTALADIVRQGKALYAGISNYNAEQSALAIPMLLKLGVPCLIHQASYSMLNRWIEGGLLDVLEKEGTGCICFSPLSQGLLTSRYLNGEIPQGSRASKNGFLKTSSITPQLLKKLNSLNEIAQKSGKSLSALAIQWILRDKRVTSVLIGASSAVQLKENLSALSHPPINTDELENIEKILVDG